MKLTLIHEIFKSAVAFFFLFFLHGTSIGIRQQGISYNYRLTETKPKQNAHSFNKIRFEVPIQKPHKDDKFFLMEIINKYKIGK